MPPPPVEDDETIEEKRDVSIDLDPPIQPPRSLGGYRVGRLIGLIRAGTAFEARRKATGRSVVLSIVKPRWASSAASSRGSPGRPTPPARSSIRPHPDARFRHRQATRSSRRGGSMTSRCRTRRARGARPDGTDRRDPASGSRAEVCPRAGTLSPGCSAWQDPVMVGLVRLADLGIGLTPETPEVPAIAPIPMAGSTGSPPSPRPMRRRRSFAKTSPGSVGAPVPDRRQPRRSGMTPGLASIVRRIMWSSPEEPSFGAWAPVPDAGGRPGVGGVFTPREEEAAEFEACVRSFTEPPLARLRPAGSRRRGGPRPVRRPGPGIRQVLDGAGAISFAAILAVALLAMKGTSGRDPLFDRIRELILGGRATSSRRRRRGVGGGGRLQPACSAAGSSSAWSPSRWRRRISSRSSGRSRRPGRARSGEQPT